ncbi:MAG TPA: RT0821/Lpp0805 family surface protein [Xanthobacteraceae bacterium]|nr:RT0821/Lpp0805 family surface protein [Xanthobacteraceae bacterium]
MLACGDPTTCRRFQYNGTAALRLCRPLRYAAGVGAVLCALAVSGCSYRLASLAATDPGDSTVTGSIAPVARPSPNSPAPGASATDLAYARAAASNALAYAGKDASVPWQNPQTGAGGNIMPLDMSYSEGGLPCRDFLASYVHGTAQDWLRGAACRSASGSWEVTRLQPLTSG